MRRMPISNALASKAMAMEMKDSINSGYITDTQLDEWWRRLKRSLELCKMSTQYYSMGDDIALYAFINCFSAYTIENSRINDQIKRLFKYRSLNDFERTDKKIIWGEIEDVVKNVEQILGYQQ